MIMGRRGKLMSNQNWKQELELLLFVLGQDFFESFWEGVLVRG